MPQPGEHPHAACLQFGRARILVLVDHVLVEAVSAISARRLGFHPGAHERGQVQPGVAVEHQFVVHDLIRDVRIDPSGRKGVLRHPDRFPGEDRIHRHVAAVAWGCRCADGCCRGIPGHYRAGRPRGRAHRVRSRCAFTRMAATCSPNSARSPTRAGRNGSRMTRGGAIQNARRLARSPARPPRWSPRQRRATAAPGRFVQRLASAGRLRRFADRHARGYTTQGHPGRRRTGATGGQRTAPAGLDVSSHQGNVNWAGAAANHGMFGYVKATEGIDLRQPVLHAAVQRLLQAGLISGAYHFATPNTSGGANQATAS